MAYLREMPVQSLKIPTLKRVALRAGEQVPKTLDGGMVKHEVLADTNQALFAKQDLQ